MKKIILAAWLALVGLALCSCGTTQPAATGPGINTNDPPCAVTPAPVHPR